MFCSKCGKQIEVDAKFCNKCGALVGGAGSVVQAPDGVRTKQTLSWATFSSAEPMAGDSISKHRRNATSQKGSGNFLNVM